MDQYKNFICVLTNSMLGASCLFAFGVWMYYRRSNNELARAVGAQSGSESWNMLVTCLFSAIETTDLWWLFDWRVSTCMRWAMGLVAMRTTYRLFKATRAVEILAAIRRERAG